MRCYRLIVRGSWFMICAQRTGFRDRGTEIYELLFAIYYRETRELKMANMEKEGKGWLFCFSRAEFSVQLSRFGVVLRQAPPRRVGNEP